MIKPSIKPASPIYLRSVEERGIREQDAGGNLDGDLGIAGNRGRERKPLARNQAPGGFIEVSHILACAPIILNLK